MQGSTGPCVPLSGRGVTVSPGITGDQTDENEITDEVVRYKPLKSRHFPLVRCTHNAGVEGSTPSLSTNTFKYSCTSSRSHELQVLHPVGSEPAVVWGSSWNIRR